MWLVPPGATAVLGADDTVERHSGRKIKAKGGYREAVRSTHQHVIHCVGLTWVVMMLLVPVPWRRRVWVFPLLTTRCRPASKSGPRRHKTSVDWVRQMVKPVHRWLPDRRLVLVVDGGFAASRWRWPVSSLVWPWSRACGGMPPCITSRAHPRTGPNSTKGTRQRSLQSWAERADTPWEDMEVAWYGGQHTQRWGFSRTALWYTPRLPAVASRSVLVADPQGQLRMEAFCCTDLQATPS